jgi:uncharacterized repeat protein (TIGR03806 family)
MRRAIRIGALAVVVLGGGCGDDGAGGPSDAAPVDAAVADAPLADGGAEACRFPSRPPQPVELSPPWPDLDVALPVSMRPHPDGQRWYVAGLVGRIVTFTAASSAQPSLVLDISDRVNIGGESGLTAFALHPDFPDTPEIYVSYTAPPPCTGAGCPSSTLRIARYTSSDGGLTAPAASEEILLEATSDDPKLWHQNADLAFGPDGLLYATFGDGGASLDAEGNAQNPDSLLGKVLRIDVDDADPGLPYAIPPGNPFAGGGGRPEVYALGLRSPWRMTFDRMTGELWLGDVGEDSREEVNRIVAGGNYGWPHLEGTYCIQPPCDNPAFIAPVYEYAHDLAGGRAVSVGYVYRGEALPSIVGKLVVADFVSGRLWAVDGDGQAELIHSGNTGAVTFGQGIDGELMVAYLQAGEIQALVPGRLDLPGFPELPDRITQTGCMDEVDPTVVDDDLFVPYEINVPFWSDGTGKRRWLRLPSGQPATLGAEDHVDLPVGTVVVKEFSWQDQVFETRFMIHHQEGWGFYTYQWNDDRTEATLLPDDAEPTPRALPGLDWIYPDRGGCLACHGDAAGVSLGPTIAQLNREVDDGTGGMLEQIPLLMQRGVLPDDLPPPDQLAAFPAPDDTSAPLEDRARAWLHSNCAHCHRPGGGATTSFDLRATVPLADAKLCDVLPGYDMEIAGARLIAPGDPDRSIVLQRMATVLPYLRMPPGYSTVVDEQGRQLLDDWIAAMTACP